jgi:hypothetical protein
MRWRDIRFEKPTEADGDQYGEVLFFDNDGDICASSWSNDTDGHLFWMAMSEIPKPPDRIPDPPEGWRFVKTGEAFDKRAKVWVLGSKEWVKTWQEREYDSRYVYIVPIDPPKPPEPQYRPFANAAEFEPYELKFWRYKDDCKDLRRKPCSYSNDGHFGDQWCQSFDNKVFSDGSPFGVMVEP